MNTSFEPTDKQQLYIRQPLGVYYARLYSGGKTKWVSLKTPNKIVAKIELAKLLQTHYAVQDAESATRKGNATIGELADIYLHGVDLDTDLKPATKDYRRKTVQYLLRSWADLRERIPAKITEAECKAWAAQYHADFSETLYNNTVDTLRHIFALAINRGLIARNPALSISKVKVPQGSLSYQPRINSAGLSRRYAQAAPQRRTGVAISSSFWLTPDVGSTKRRTCTGRT